MKIIRKIKQEKVLGTVKVVKQASINALELAREVKRKNRESGIIDVKKNPKQVWELEKTSMRKAINANCYDCIGAENHIKRIRFCNIINCPFWLLRPYSKGITQEQCLQWVEDPVKEKDNDSDPEDIIDDETLFTEEDEE